MYYLGFVSFLKSQNISETTEHLNVIDTLMPETSFVLKEPGMPLMSHLHCLSFHKTSMKL